jgi:hypothetical protein
MRPVRLKISDYNISLYASDHKATEKSANRRTIKAGSSRPKLTILQSIKTIDTGCSNRSKLGIGLAVARFMRAPLNADIVFGGSWLLIPSPKPIVKWQFFTGQRALKTKLPNSHPSFLNRPWNFAVNDYCAQKNLLLPNKRGWRILIWADGISLIFLLPLRNFCFGNIVNQ